MTDRWVWEETDAARSGAAGDLAKLFKNEQIEQPGVLAKGAPNMQATVLAREVIQNSWDAAQDLRKVLEKEQIRVERRDRSARSAFLPPPFAVQFHFYTAEGTSKEKLVRELALAEHAGRLRGGGFSRKDVGLKERDCLSTLEDPSSGLSYMVIEEEAASGMYGPWRGDKSKMYKALCGIGFTSGIEGRGGSYGYGKAGLIRGSAIRVVVAYTCFRENSEDKGITRRLLGMTYWGRYDYGNESLTGFARLGKHNKQGKVIPFENEEADEQASRLGLKVRNSAETAELGTTFLLIDPTVTDKDLVVAIERSWWPALEERKLQFHASVHTASGEVLHPRPRLNPDLRTFIDAYEIAMRAIPEGDGSRGDYSGLGIIGLVSDIDGWSYAEQTRGTEDQDIDHCSLVALMREPRMVVEYHRARQGWSTPPYVRGVFIADQQINEALRHTEPKGHDTWDCGSEDADVEDQLVCQNIYKRIRQKVGQYKRELSPPARPAEEIELPWFDDLMKRLLSGQGRPAVPDSNARFFSIRTDLNLETNSPDEVSMVGKVSFSFSEIFEEEEALIEVSIFYRFLEDERSGSEANIEITPRSRFEKIDDKFQGVLRRQERAVFELRTQPYRADWSGRLVAGAEIIRSTKREP